MKLTDNTLVGTPEEFQVFVEEINRSISRNTLGEPGVVVELPLEGNEPAAEPVEESTEAFQDTPSDAAGA